jgi:hypothetical protein
MGLHLYINLKFNGSNTLLLSWRDRAATRYGPQDGPPVVEGPVVSIFPFLFLDLFLKNKISWENLSKLPTIFTFEILASWSLKLDPMLIGYVILFYLLTNQLQLYLMFLYVPIYLLFLYLPVYNNYTCCFLYLLFYYKCTCCAGRAIPAARVELYLLQGGAIYTYNLLHGRSYIYNLLHGRSYTYNLLRGRSYTYNLLHGRSYTYNLLRGRICSGGARGTNRCPAPPYGITKHEENFT